MSNVFNFKSKEDKKDEIIKKLLKELDYYSRLSTWIAFPEPRGELQVDFQDLDVSDIEQNSDGYYRGGKRARFLIENEWEFLKNYYYDK